MNPLIEKYRQQILSLAHEHGVSTDIYHTLDGALFCLVKDANINGLSKLKADEADLFK